MPLRCSSFHFFPAFRLTHPCPSLSNSARGQARLASDFRPFRALTSALKGQKSFQMGLVPLKEYAIKRDSSPNLNLCVSAVQLMNIIR
jgi:hypothetical protein